MSKVSLSWLRTAIALSLSALGCGGDDDGAGAAAAQSTASSAGHTGGAGHDAGDAGAAGSRGGSGVGSGGSGAASGTGGAAGSTSGVAGRGGSGAGTGGGAAAGASGGGCSVGGKQYADGESGIPAPDGCNTCICDDGQLGCTERGCQPDEQCVVARRLDRCCPVYEAVARSALATDECLVEEPGAAPDAARAQRCFDQSPDDCTRVLCAPVPPPSRLGAPDGAGDCSFVDECTSPEDCVIGWDSRQCCACPTSMPKTLLERDACLLEQGGEPPGGVQCPACTSPVQCGACEPPPETPTCVIGDALNRCQ